jgi:hypothetical protein
LDALPARGQPPDGADRPRPGINPGQGRWLQKIWGLVWRGGGCQQCFGYSSNSFESVYSIPIGPGILWDGASRLSRSLTTGGPLHAAPFSRVCLSPVWTRRPALPGDLVKERINNLPVNTW